MGIIKRTKNKLYVQCPPAVFTDAVEIYSCSVEVKIKIDRYKIIQNILNSVLGLLRTQGSDDTGKPNWKF